MLKKFLNEVVVIVVGKQAEEIAGLLDTNKHVNEFLIAKKMDITINQTRNILYKLSDQGLVSSIRKKDKRKGWYTYFWKIEVLKSLEFLKGILVKRIDQIEHQIKSRETKDFYVCERCNIEFSEENALLHDFTCNECGGIFTLKDNAKLLKEFKKNLDKIRKDLAIINEEIKKEKEKEDKKKQKEILKEEKAKKAKRKANRKKAMRIKKKLEKASGKKKKVKSEKKAKSNKKKSVKVKVKKAKKKSVKKIKKKSPRAKKKRKK